MNSMIPETFARKVATNVAARELIAARAIGYSDDVAYEKSFRAGNGAYVLAMSQDKPFTTMGLRFVSAISAAE